MLTAAVLCLGLWAGSAAGEAVPSGTDLRLLAQDYPPGCPPGGYGVASCPNFGKPSVPQAGGATEATPPPNYEDTNECLKAGWGVAECQGFDKWWKKHESVETVPNAQQHQGCGGYGVTECPQGGGAGGRR